MHIEYRTISTQIYQPIGSEEKRFDPPPHNVVDYQPKPKPQKPESSKTEFDQQITQMTILFPFPIVSLGIQPRGLQNTEVCTNRGANIDRLIDVLQKKDMSTYRTIIIHIGGNDLDNENDDLVTYGFNKCKGLKICSHNVNRLECKFDEIRYNLMSTPNPPDIIGYCETFLGKNTSDREIDIPGYILQRKDRQSDGGVAGLSI
ncbi:unnamed protein product [Mytilus edulis]|uniref:Uncharacterized protein n=1 Tax=Mytilus edulis TaxID=6550 RepID=A0A8S3SKM1_MYTED|nr:unnamed protein product [Mytilus edulis]